MLSCTAVIKKTARETVFLKKKSLTRLFLLAVLNALLIMCLIQTTTALVGRTVVRSNAKKLQQCG